MESPRPSYHVPRPHRSEASLAQVPDRKAGLLYMTTYLITKTDWPRISIGKSLTSQRQTEGVSPQFRRC